MFSSNERLVESICQRKIDETAFLLCNGANPNGVIDKVGLTPLHFAVVYGAPESILLLAAAGADIFQKDEEGSSAFDIAIQIENSEAVYIFLFYLYMKSKTIN